MKQPFGFPLVIDQAGPGTGGRSSGVEALYFLSVPGENERAARIKLVPPLFLENEQLEKLGRERNLSGVFVFRFARLQAYEPSSEVDLYPNQAENLALTAARLIREGNDRDQVVGQFGSNLDKLIVVEEALPNVVLG